MGNPNNVNQHLIEGQRNGQGGIHFCALLASKPSSSLIMPICLQARIVTVPMMDWALIR